jgi:hypothetical protein
MRRHFLFIFSLFFAGGISPLGAQSPVSPFDTQEYDMRVSSSEWSQPPADHHRLYFDVLNITDFFDSETGGVAGFADQTLLSDTIRPTVTVLWDERFRIELGLIAQKKYGNDIGFQPVDPWIQLLWQPVKPLSVLFGDLNVPHYFLPALFYPTNYFIQSPDENGAQLVLKTDYSYDDFYFNYRLLDTHEHNEKFDFGFVHRNRWKWFYFDYQAHWIHDGGELNPHPYDTRNDVAQAAGLSAQLVPAGRPGERASPLAGGWILGAGYHYLHSHLRQDADTPAYLIPSTNGDGNLAQAYAYWRRLKLIYGDWRGRGFYHEGGDPMFKLPVLDMVTFRWDILLSRDFNLYAETTGYFIGNNNLGYSHDVKAAFHLQCSWQFSIPVTEWTTPAAAPEGEKVPARWDYGL